MGLPMKFNDKSDIYGTIDEPNADWNHAGHYHNWARLVTTDLKHKFLECNC